MVVTRHLSRLTLYYQAGEPNTRTEVVSGFQLMGYYLPGNNSYIIILLQDYEADPSYFYFYNNLVFSLYLIGVLDLVLVLDILKEGNSGYIFYI